HAVAGRELGAARLQLHAAPGDVEDARPVERVPRDGRGAVGVAVGLFAERYADVDGLRVTLGVAGRLLELVARRLAHVFRATELGGLELLGRGGRAVAGAPHGHGVDGYVEAVVEATCLTQLGSPFPRGLSDGRRRRSGPTSTVHHLSAA